MIVEIHSRAANSLIEVEIINGDIKDAWYYRGLRLPSYVFQNLLDNVYDLTRIFDEVERCNG